MFRILHIVIKSLPILLVCLACSSFQPSFDPIPPSPSPSRPVSKTEPPKTLTTPSQLPASPRPTAIAYSSPSPSPQTITTILFTGVIVPARCVQAALDRSDNYDYPYEEVRSTIQHADFAVGTLNATISEVAPHTGCVPTYVLVGDSRNADALARAGFDAMSIATNHIKDCGPANCGDQAFFETLHNLQRVGIQIVGAGENEVNALQPIIFTVNGVRFAILSQGQIEQGGVYAAQNKAGIARLTEENITQAIQAIRSMVDVIIFMPHWGPEDRAIPTWIQRNLAHAIVAAGADLVVGNHTHVVQGYQKINRTWVFYGLGNFVFDQWQRDHQQGVMLRVRFQGATLLDFQWIPTHVDRDGRVHLADSSESTEIIQKIEQASRNLK